MVSQKPENLNQTMTPCREHLQVKMCEHRSGYNVGHIGTQHSFHNEMFSVLHFICLCVLFWGKGYKSRGRIRGARGGVGLVCMM